jgi:hypothetical protein
MCEAAGEEIWDRRIYLFILSYGMEPMGYGERKQERRNSNSGKGNSKTHKQASKTSPVALSSPLRSSALPSPLPSDVDLMKLVKT